MPAELQKIDLTKIAVGVFANLGGQPLDFATEQVLNRAGVHHTVPSGPEDTFVPHPLRAPLEYTHGGDTAPAIPRLPETFPPTDYDGPLTSAQDYLTLIESARPAAEQEAEARVQVLAEAETERQTKEKQATIDAAAPRLTDALQSLHNGDALAENLSAVGLDTVGKVQAASPEELQAAEGVGPKTADIIAATVSDVVNALPVEGPPLFETTAFGSLTPAETVPGIEAIAVPEAAATSA